MKTKIQIKHVSPKGDYAYICFSMEMNNLIYKIMDIRIMKQPDKCILKLPVRKTTKIYNNEIKETFDAVISINDKLKQLILDEAVKELKWDKVETKKDKKDIDAEWDDIYN